MPSLSIVSIQNLALLRAIAKIFRRHYKKRSSGFNEWEQKSHADEYMLFPENVGEFLSIDEAPLSQGELYTFVTNKQGKGKKGSLVASIQKRYSFSITATSFRKKELSERSQLRYGEKYGVRYSSIILKGKISNRQVPRRKISNRSSSTLTRQTSLGRA